MYGIHQTVADYFRKNWKKIKVVDFPESLKETGFLGIGYKNTQSPGGSYYRNQNVLIKCYGKSRVEKYAIDNNVRYELKKETTLGGVIIKDSLSVSKDALRVNWYPVALASGYEVYESTDNGTNYKLIKTINGGDNTTFKAVKLKRGTKYTYKIKAYRDIIDIKAYGPFSSAITALENPPTLKISKSTPKKKGTLSFKCKDTNRYGTIYDVYIEVYDPECKKWFLSKGFYNYKEDNTAVFEVYGTFPINPYTNRKGYEELRSGRKYKVRLRLGGYLETRTSEKDCLGSFSNTLTVKAK